jgi:hypothetical protein
MEKVVKSKIKLGLLFQVPDLLHKSQIICFNRTAVIEWKPNAGLRHG